MNRILICGLAVLASLGAFAEKKGPVEVVAVYYPHWHRYPKGDEWFGADKWQEAEWAYVKDSPPRFPGHHQPLVPLAGYLKGDSPDDMAKEIALAANAGIDVFLYDYYYYGGKTTQEESLEQGFLKAPNRSRMKFALMWCYHERKRGWRPKIFGGPRETLMGLEHRPEELLGLIRLSIDRYFRQPEYWRKDGKLFFSIYNAGYFRWKLGNGAAKETIRRARELVRAAGLGEMHLNAQCIDPAETDLFMDLGFDSFTDYNMNPHSRKDVNDAYAAGERLFDYSVVVDANRRQWDVVDRVKMPYLYSVTTGWDRSARCRPDEPFPWKGPTEDYPYQCIVTNNTPDLFEAYLREAKERAVRDPKEAGVVYINAWNEYTEGEWLVPDNFYGDGMLRAIAAVFGRKPANEYTFVDPVTKEMMTVPAATFENVAYDTRESKQKVDVWLPKNAAGRTPVVVYYHGCGWTGGVTVDRVIGSSVPRLLKAGVAVVAVGYRYLQDAPEVKPPVRTPLDDCEKALAFVISKADKWNLDRSRVVLMGGSAGAASALYVGLKDDNRYGVSAIAPILPQTTLDPEEMRRWIPNATYGAHAFGYKDFADWLAHRADCLPEIEKVSATSLLARIDPKKAPTILICCKAPPEPGVLPADPTHAAEFGVEFKRLCDRKGVACELRYGAEGNFARAFESVISHLSSR